MQVYLSMSVFVSVCVCEMERYQPFHLNSSLSDARWKSILAGLRSFPCVGWMLILIDIEILYLVISLLISLSNFLNFFKKQIGLHKI